MSADNEVSIIEYFNEKGEKRYRVAEGFVSYMIYIHPKVNIQDPDHVEIAYESWERAKEFSVKEAAFDFADILQKNHYFEYGHNVYILNATWEQLRQTYMSNLSKDGHKSSLKG